MKEAKQTAKIHVSVFTERAPEDTFDFEQKMDKLIIQEKGTRSIYSHFEHGTLDYIRDIGDMVNKIEKNFGDIGKTRFEMKQYNSKEVGKMVVVEWKNPNYNPFARAVNPIIPKNSLYCGFYLN
jgi:hypothetical protein